MQLLVEAKHIPDGTTVYKKTGETPFIVRDQLNIYAYGEGTGQPKRDVKVAENCKFMIDGRGNVNVVGGDTILRVELETDNELDLDLLATLIESRLGNDYNVTLYAEIPQ
jgi:hypothetical protein